jgi:hypothetical protein
MTKSWTASTAALAEGEDDIAPEADMDDDDANRRRMHGETASDC